MSSRLTKRDLAESLHQSGRTPAEIARALKTTEGYIRDILGMETPLPDNTNVYMKAFSGVLRFKTLEAAQASVQRIDELFHQYADAQDRRGVHQAQLMALIGHHRCEGVGKTAEAALFTDWLKKHL